MAAGKRTTLGVVLAVCVALLGACTGARLPENKSVAAGDRSRTTTTEGEGATASGPSTTTGDGTDPFAGASGSTVPKVGRAGGTGGGTTPAGGAVRSTLFSAKEDTIGITKTSINLCAHAALTYGAAFNTSADDLNVYWSAINDAGGIYGRKVTVTYENDNYSPDTAVQAATACKGKGIFFLIGGIGFDQIPAVRNWAETNHMLYLHHTATVQGTANQHYSFTGLPSTEKMGEMFGELVASRYKGKKVGIIKRNSPNWEPGVTAFKAIAKKYGVDVVAERAVQNNQGSYTQEILDMQRAGADVVWVWENALASTQIVKQAKAQAYNPQFLLFPFNLTSQTLGQDALNPKMVGVAMYPAYSKGDYSGSFAPYADDIKEFEAQYFKYRPNAPLKGVGGDLLFLNWTGQKGLAELLKACGPDCTRNRLVDVLTSYKATKPFPSSCNVDFTRPGFPRMGGSAVNIMETYRNADGVVNWRNTDTCVEHLL
ncbi:MAG: branched-chain amino acid transport system substrate-binding protein [Actinomycetota bacterium]|jgi:branched-chain amino acid transport system substrate-binding protein